ncbi:MAG: DUF6318 family protein [Dermatophilaceae bacterium]
MKRTSAVLVAVPLAVSTLLAGCGGDAKPGASSSSTSTSSPTATPAPTTPSASPTTTASPTTDPNIPAAARAHTPAGAEAFVRYFVERLNVAWTAPVAGILSPLCQATSKACAANEKTATRLVKEGHRYDGNPVTIKVIAALDSASPNHLDVLANVVQERRSEIDAAGKTYATDERKDLRLDFELLYTGQAWSVASTRIMK